MIEVKQEIHTNLKDFRGASDDTKPTEDICEGSTFYEWDTGDLYMFDGTAWVSPGNQDDGAGDDAVVS